MEVMPNTWEVQAFGMSYSEPSRNGIYKSAEFQGRGTRIVNMGEMFGYEFISDQEMNRIALTSKEMSMTNLRDGDLLFGRRSVVPAGAGKCSLVVKPLEPLTFESSIIRVRLNHTIANPLFHYYFFGSSIGRHLMSNIVAGTNIKGIRGSELRELQIPLPSLQEQCAIATALLDMDELLGGLDRLIAKKRNLKQAAMQQLLSGKTRLPGFSGEWTGKTLGQVCKITTGKKDVNEGDHEGDYPFFTCARTHTFSKSYSFEGEAILIAGNGEVGNLSYFNGKFEAYQRTYVVQGFTTHLNYLWHQLSAHLADSLGIGTIGSSIPYIKKENLTGFAFEAPLDKEEQFAIAKTLSDLDTEIVTLQQQRNKTAALKQGMMQELLTGRTRLV